MVRIAFYSLATKTIRHITLILHHEKRPVTKEIQNAIKWLAHNGCWHPNPLLCPKCNQKAVYLDTPMASTCDHCGAQYERALSETSMKEIWIPQTQQ